MGSLIFLRNQDGEFIADYLISRKTKYGFSSLIPQYNSVIFIYGNYGICCRLGDGTKYTNYYRTSYEYDTMGRFEYLIKDVSDESTYDREQVTKYYYDYLGRRTKVEEGVSDNTHDITASKLRRKEKLRQKNFRS